jgi:hypothetical protein
MQPGFNRTSRALFTITTLTTELSVTVVISIVFLTMNHHAAVYIRHTSRSDYKVTLLSLESCV